MHNTHMVCVCWGVTYSRGDGWAEREWVLRELAAARARWRRGTPWPCAEANNLCAAASPIIMVVI